MNQSLIAYAYLKTSQNPLVIFCNYICYCISKSSNPYVVIDQIEGELEKEFKIILKKLVLQTCIKILLSEKRIAIDKRTNGIRLLEIGFDIERFERDRQNLSIQENRFIADFLAFVAKFNTEEKWSSDKAIKLLGEVLSRKEISYDLAFNGDSTVLRGTVHPKWYIGRFIREILDDKTSGNYRYITDVSRGLMLYFGATAITEDGYDYKQKFSARFYFDTKLMLRLLGYTLPFHCQATVELFELIVKENNGEIWIFEHTLNEILNALYYAEQDYRSGKFIKNDELSMYAELNKIDADDLHVIYASARRRIEEEFHINVHPPIDWNDPEVQDHNIDGKALEEWIKKREPIWKSATIKNDVASVNAINILRKSKYSEYFAGKSGLPIFVTTNTALVSAIKSFIYSRSEETDQENSVAWTSKKLPVISDMSLICRLWLPHSNKLTTTPVITLAANALAAQQTSPEFYKIMGDHIKHGSILFKDQPIIIDEIRKSKLEDIIVGNAHGKLSEIDQALFTKSISDLIQMEAIDDKKKISELKSQNVQKDDSINRSIKGITEILFNQAHDRIDLKIIRFKYSLYDKWLATLSGAFLTVLIDFILLLISSQKQIPLYTYIVPVLLSVLGLFFDKSPVSNKLLSEIRSQKLNDLKKLYCTKIAQMVPADLYEYTEQFQKHCIENEPCFLQNSKE